MSIARAARPPLAEMLDHRAAPAQPAPAAALLHSRITDPDPVIRVFVTNDHLLKVPLLFVGDRTSRPAHQHAMPGFAMLVSPLGYATPNTSAQYIVFCNATIDVRQAAQ